MRIVGDEPVLLLDHLGYSTGAEKVALLARPDDARVGRISLFREADTAAAAAPEAAAGGDPVVTSARPRELVRDLVAEPAQAVAAWGPARYQRIDFSDLREPGTYRIVAEVEGRRLSSAPFEIADHRAQSMTVADLTAYFRSARSSGEIDRKDRHAGFYGDGSGAEVDARGGWLDASGDYSKFLSHLTYTRMMSPQQIPLCAWAMMAAADELRLVHPDFRTSQLERLRDEALFGADFLVRFQSPEGYFYTAIFDALTKRLDERVITAPLQDSVRTQRWQAAYRHGGGMAIAALARAATLDDHGEVDAEGYLGAAIRGFACLEEHNTEYLFDGRESVIDDYCALMAAVELARALEPREAGSELPSAVGRATVADAARRRVGNLLDRRRVEESGACYLEGDHLGTPYFHAAESGLPVVALLRFAEVFPEDDLAEHAVGLALDLLRGTVQRVDAVPNPFGYLRQRVQSEGGAPREAFFYPHENETGYWWQGENANISSVAFAALCGARRAEADPALGKRLRGLSADLLGWVTGRNPFDACMLQGRGRNNLEYSGVYQNSPGGIVNGITGGFEDEDGIDFLPAGRAADGNEWRWAEQWIPHSAWFLLAVCAAP